MTSLICVHPVLAVGAAFVLGFLTCFIVLGVLLSSAWSTL